MAATSNILVIGGSGFLSGTLARRALSRGNKVWTLTRGQRDLPVGTKNLIADRHDLEMFERVIGTAQTKWDIVIDCIAYAPEDIQQDLRVFEKLTHHLVFVSTDFVYDPQYRQFPQREDTEFFDTVGYGLQKRLSELELIRYAGDLPWTIVRPCHIYGPGSLLGCLPAHSRDPDLINRLRAGESINLVGGGRFLQQPILARDLADFLLDLRGCDAAYSQILNAAGPDVIESWMYYQIIADLLDVDLSIEEVAIAPYLEENPGSSSFICHRFYDLSRAAEIGVPLPGTPIKQGLLEHVESLLVEETA